MQCLAEHIYCEKLTEFKFTTDLKRFLKHIHRYRHSNFHHNNFSIDVQSIFI